MANKKDTKKNLVFKNKKQPWASIHHSDKANIMPRSFFYDSNLTFCRKNTCLLISYKNCAKNTRIHFAN